MGTVKRFEDLKVWQKAREFVKNIYEATSTGLFAKDFGLKDQIRRAGVSIMLNIAEGFAPKTNKEFSHFLVQAHGSSAEVQSALYIALDQHYISPEIFNKLYLKTEEVSKMLTSLIQYLQKH
jgi:four helix bundle protein